MACLLCSTDDSSFARAGSERRGSHTACSTAICNGLSARWRDNGAWRALENAVMKALKHRHSFCLRYRTPTSHGVRLRRLFRAGRSWEVQRVVGTAGIGSVFHVEGPGALHAMIVPSRCFSVDIGWTALRRASFQSRRHAIVGNRSELTDGVEAISARVRWIPKRSKDQGIPLV
jgi:hypothetical protein